MVRHILLALVVLLVGIVGPFLMPSGASADGGLLDSIEEGLTNTQDQPVEAQASVDSTSGDLESAVQTVTEASQPVSESTNAATIPVVESVSDAAQPLTESVGKIAEPVVQSVSPVLEPVIDAAEPLVESGVNVVSPVVEPVVESVEPVVEPIVELAEPVAEPILELTKPVLAPIVETTQPVLEPILELTEPVAPTPIMDLTDPVLDPPLDNEEPGDGLLPVVPVPDPSPLDLINPIVEDREPLPPYEPMTQAEEPRDITEVPSNLPTFERAYSDPWSSSVVRFGDGLRALGMTDEGLEITALIPSASGAPVSPSTPNLLRDDPSSYRLQDGSRLGDGLGAPRTPAGTSVLLLFNEGASGSAGSGNRIDWPDSGLVGLLAALFAIGVLLLLSTTEASPRAWQFRPVTPPA